MALLFVQLPDDSGAWNPIFESKGFLARNPVGIAEATCLVATADSPAAILSRMGKTTRNQIHRAQTLGVNIREGTDCRRVNPHGRPCSCATAPQRRMG